MSRISAATAAEVHQRADGHCEACTLPLGVDGGVFHHRKLRSRGGLDDAVNLMEVHMVCHTGHARSIHGCPARSDRLGHMVSAGADPADVPVIVAVDLFALRA